MGGAGLLALVACVDGPARLGGAGTTGDVISIS